MEKIDKKSNKLGILLWSIALPGFGQLLNRRYVKGIILVGLEFLVNVKGNINQVIVLSFQGMIQEAINQADYLWLMFYPCLYFFAIWDAFNDQGGSDKPFGYLPLVFTTYLVTIAVIYSPVFTFFGNLIGPIWLSIIFTPIGLGVGSAIRWFLLQNISSN